VSALGLGNGNVWDKCGLPEQGIETGRSTKVYRYQGINIRQGEGGKQMVEGKITIKQWLEDVAGKNTSTEEDSRCMEKLLQNSGFPASRVVMGIVYVEGHGQPVDIHSMARMILGVVVTTIH
jgi:hypothetical protein